MSEKDYYIHKVRRTLKSGKVKTYSYKLKKPPKLNKPNEKVKEKICSFKKQLVNMVENLNEKQCEDLIIYLKK
jgi:hypothetical protein